MGLERRFREHRAGREEGRETDMVELEIIARRPERGRRDPRLLFVHGICVGAWIWDEHFLPFFAEAGFEAHAVSLRGHGGSGGRDRLSSWRLADYTDDLREAARRVGGPLAVIGHSLGGAVVQDWLRTGGTAVAAALLASVPPWGLAASAWRMRLASPALFREVAIMSVRGAAAADPEVMRRGLFSDDLPADVYARFARRIQDESPLVGAELQGWRPFAPPPWRVPPMLVLGGAADRFVPLDEVWRTAAYYGVEPVIVPRLAHAVMLEPRWEAVARALLAWLTTLPGQD
jgi:pimeloyl-ACP methyl ester carboxylesterase